MATISAAFSLSLFSKTGHKIKGIPHVPDLPPCDLTTEEASPEAAVLADHLNLTASLRQLQNSRKQTQSYQNERIPPDLREQIRDLKEDITERIEQTRLEIDYTQAELAVDVAIQNELLRTYTEARDKKVNAMNTWAFRINGALWAVAEGLDIPTYNHPRYSIPSGTVGILAGIVPGVFSLAALKESKGDHYQGATRPNMLSKLFDYATTPQIEYPESILTYLHSVPTSVLDGKPRIDYLIDRWAADSNIHSFTDKYSRKQLDIITGHKEDNLTIEIICDRLTMLQQLSAVIYQINRPLLELMMVVRGTKYLH